MPISNSLKAFSPLRCQRIMEPELQGSGLRAFEIWFPVHTGLKYRSIHVFIDVILRESPVLKLGHKGHQTAFGIVSILIFSEPESLNTRHHCA